MEAMVKEWTDGRLDDLSDKVDRGFEHVDQRFEQVDQRFEQVDQRFEQVDRQFAEVNRRLDRVELEVRDLRLDTKSEFTAIREDLGVIQRALIFGFIAMSSAIVGGFTAIATQV